MKPLTKFIFFILVGILVLAIITLLPVIKSNLIYLWPIASFLGSLFTLILGIKLILRRNWLGFLLFPITIYSLLASLILFGMFCCAFSNIN